MWLLLMSAFHYTFSPESVAPSAVASSLTINISNAPISTSDGSIRPPSIVQLVFSFPIGDDATCLLQKASDWDEVEVAVLDTGRLVPETKQPYCNVWSVSRSSTATNLTFTLTPTRKVSDYIVPGSSLQLTFYMPPISANPSNQPVQHKIGIEEHVRQRSGGALSRSVQQSNPASLLIKKTADPPSLQALHFTILPPANGSSTSFISVAGNLSGREGAYNGLLQPFMAGADAQFSVFCVPFVVPPRSAGVVIDSFSFERKGPCMQCVVGIYQQSEAGNATEGSDCNGSCALIYEGRFPPRPDIWPGPMYADWASHTVSMHPVGTSTSQQGIQPSGSSQYLFAVLVVEAGPGPGSQTPSTIRAWINSSGAGNRQLYTLAGLDHATVSEGDGNLPMRLSHTDLTISLTSMLPMATLNCTQITPPTRQSPYVTSVPKQTEVRAVILSNLETMLSFSATGMQPFNIMSTGSAQPIYYPPSGDTEHHLPLVSDTFTATVSDTTKDNQKSATVTSYDAIPLFTRCYSAPVCNVLDPVYFDCLDTRWLRPKLKVVNSAHTKDVDEYPWQESDAFFKAVKDVDVYVLANSSAAQYSSVGQHITVCDPRLWTFTINLSADRSTLQLSWDWEPDQSTQTCSGGVTVQFDSAKRKRWVQLLVPASMNASQYSISSSTIAPKVRPDVSTDLVYTVELQTYRTDVTCRITPFCSTSSSATVFTIPNISTALVYPNLDQPRPAQAMFSARQSLSHFDIGSKQYVSSYYILGLSFGLKKASSGAPTTFVNLLGACFSVDGSGSFSSDKVEPPYDASTNQPVVINTSATDATLHLYPRLPGQSTPAAGYALYKLDCDVLVDKSDHGRHLDTSRLLPHQGLLQ